MWTEMDLQRYLDRLQEQKMKLGLERMAALCAQLGHPERCAPAIHIAGTNGKGSTAAFLRSWLQSAGYRVGVYTSPHLQSFLERFTIDGEPFALDAVCAMAEALAAATAVDQPTYFEFVTLLAMRLFQSAAPDVVIYEVGLGGRLDATNVVCPEVAVLTPIAYDHQQWLGADLASIAREKCGIIKPGGAVVSAPQDSLVADVIGQICAERGATIHWADPLAADLPVGLAGVHQRINAGVARQVGECLAARGWRRGDVRAFATACWPGRCELLDIGACPQCQVVFDGAHNPAAAQALAAHLRVIRGVRRVICGLGVMRDKDVEGIIAALAPVVDEFWALTAPGPRALAGEELCARLCAMGCTARPMPWEELRHALLALDAQQLLVMTGSLYLYDPLQNVLRGGARPSAPLTPLATQPSVGHAHR